MMKVSSWGPGPDHLVLTAAHEEQAAGFRAQLEWRREAGLLGDETTCHVLADPGGLRVGSGGSTLLALRHLAARLSTGGSLSDAFTGRRVFLIHAGGAATRLPAYAALGKVFLPLPCRIGRGHPAALFDLILAQLSCLPKPRAGHVVVAAGDVLLTLPRGSVNLDRPGVTGLAFVGTPERASRHGVYVVGEDRRVVDFLQKPSVERLGRSQRGDDARVLIDSGVMSLGPTAVEALLRASGCSARGGRICLGPGLLADLDGGTPGSLDLYEDVAVALARETTARHFERRILSQPRHAGPGRRASLMQFFRGVRDVPFQADVLERCEFFHPGTSSEVLSGFTERSSIASHGFLRASGSKVPAWCVDQSACAIDTTIESERFSCGPSVLLDAVHCRSSLDLAGRNIVTGLGPEVTRPIALPEGIGLTLLPLRGRHLWAAVLYGVDDRDHLFLNAPMADFLHRHGVLRDCLWPDGAEQTPYHARLWLVGTPDEVVSKTSWMLSDVPDLRATSRWREEDRRSLAELVHAADHLQMLAHRRRCRWAGGPPTPAPRDDLTLDERPWTDGGRDGPGASGRDDGQAGEWADPIRRARMLARATATCTRAGTSSAGGIRSAPGGPRDPDGPLDRAIRSEVSRAVAAWVAPRPARSPCAPGRLAARASAPARLDLAGGWTDTPPICLERGGAVVNMAVSVGGGPPIATASEMIDELIIKIYINGKLVKILRDVEQVFDHSDPRDPSALAKACLSLSGLTGDRLRGDLGDSLRPLGGGIALKLSSALPQGSGLGTSSILGATTLASLAGLLGEEVTRTELVRRVLMMEQRLTTGGGWQDQVGGIYPGVKLARTQAGPDQSPAVTQLSLPVELRRRMLLYYTGISRVARGLLTNVVGSYLAGHRRTHRTIDELVQNATQMGLLLSGRGRGDFGEEFRRYWDLKARLDPNISPPIVDELLGRVRPLCTGWGLLGAGGGGFLLLVARDDDSVGPIRTALLSGPPGSRFFDFEVDEIGLSVDVFPGMPRGLPARMAASRVGGRP